MDIGAIRRYVALGDSLTEGIWDGGMGDRSFGFAHLLAAQLRRANPAIEVINLGINGARTADVLGGPLARAVALRPELVTVVVGANDVPFTPTAQFQREYTALLGQLRAATDGMIVASTLPNLADVLPAAFAAQRAAIEQRLAEFNHVITAAATASGAVLVDLFQHPASADPLNISRDGIHPNPRGYRIMAQVFIAALQQQGIEVEALKDHV